MNQIFVNNNNTIYHTRDNKNDTIEIYISLFYISLYYMDLWQKAKSILRKVKEEDENWLKTKHSNNEDYSIQSHHFMENRWVNNGPKN